jgi:flagellar basal-body rod modification protein FlgD
MTTSQQVQVVGVPYTQQSSSSKTILGKDDFLKMLVAQLRNQDPLNPMDGTEFAAQLAQFSSVEQLANINSNLSDSMAMNQLLTQAVSNTMSASLIGLKVRATSSNIQYSGEKSVKFGYTLPVNANTVTVKIFDQNNKLVRTLTGGTGIGDQTVTWDGEDQVGNTVASGSYRFAVEAVDAKGSTMQSTQFIFGTVTAVRFKPNGAVFVIDGAEVPLADILEILRG